MSELDDIMKPIFSYGVDWTEHKDSGGPNGDHDVSVFATTTKGEMQAQVKREVKALMLELIGAGEPTMIQGKNVPYKTGNAKGRLRNTLRVELRKKVEEL